ncbi:MAG: hypothetical protein AAF581_18235 [Planctomycetota bacterium]
MKRQTLVLVITVGCGLLGVFILLMVTRRDWNYRDVTMERLVECEDVTDPVQAVEYMRYWDGPVRPPDGTVSLRILEKKVRLFPGRGLLMECLDLQGHVLVTWGAREFYQSFVSSRTADMRDY